MTRTYEQVTKTETTTRRTCTAVHCDKCGEAMDTKEADYGDRDVEVSVSTSVYYEETYRTGWKVHDLCVACGDALRQLLIDNGYLVKDHDGVDYEEWG